MGLRGLEGLVRVVEHAPAREEAHVEQVLPQVPAAVQGHVLHRPAGPQRRRGRLLEQLQPEVPTATPFKWMREPNVLESSTEGVCSVVLH